MYKSAQNTGKPSTEKHMQISEEKWLHNASEKFSLK